MGKLSLFTMMAVAVFLVFTISCVSKEVQVTETYYETEYRTEVDRKENTTVLKPETEWWVPHRADMCLLYQLDATYYYGYRIDMPEGSSGQVNIRTMKNLPYKVPMPEIDRYWYALVVDLTDVGQLPRLSPQGGELPKTINTLVTSPEYHPYLTDFRPVLFQTLNEGPTLRPKTDPSDPDYEEALRLTCLLPTFEGFEKSQRLLAYSEYPLTFERDFTFDAKGVEEFAIIILATSTVTPTVELTCIGEISHQVPYQVEKQRTVTESKKVPFWEAIFSR